MARQANGVSAFMAEHVNYGGVAATRHQVYQDMMRRFPNARQTAEYTAFTRPALPADQVEQYIPWGIVCTGCSADLRTRSSHPVESMCHPCWMEHRKAGRS